MAIITEEPEPEPSPPVVKPPSPPKPNKPIPAAQSSNNSSPFAFWFYFTLGVSIITLSTVFLSSFSQSSDPKSFFLSLPSPLRSHYSQGRIVKVQLAQSQNPVEVFVFQGEEKGKIIHGTENVVIVHGFGLSSFSFRKVVSFLASRGIRGVALDLPGNGFSDKSREVMEERGNGFFDRVFDVYGLIKEKGLFWAFDNMVETGELPYEAVQSHFSGEKSVARPIVLESEEVGKVLGQVIGTIGLAPVHLVLHDSSLNMVANWVSENPTLVRSVTLVDTGSRSALPLWVLQLPLVREVVLGSNFVYQRLISGCCSKGIGGSDLESHRMVLRDGRSAVVGTEMMMNASFDVAEWGGLDGVKGMPMQVVWSRSWSKEWSDEGRRVSDALPQAKFVEHSGGRVSDTRDDNTAEEIGEHVATFVSSLPKSVREAEEERVPEHIQQMLDEAKQNPNHHHHHGHSSLDHGQHDHGHGSDGYMDAYGLGQAWGS